MEDFLKLLDLYDSSRLLFL